MDWSAIWHGVLSNLVYGILILGGGALLAYLRAKFPNYAGSALYGFIGAACVAVILFTFSGRGLFTSHPPEVTPDNVEESIKKWCDNEALGTVRMPTPDAYFGLLITMSSGNQVLVYRGREKSGFLQMQVPLALSSEHLQMLSKLSKEQADDAMEDITLELNRARIGYILQTSVTSPLASAQVATTKPTIFQQTLLITRPLAITSDLSEPAFMAQINEIDSEVGLVRGVTDVTLKRYSRMPPQKPSANGK
jgi:hypothetical protein